MKLIYTCDKVGIAVVFGTAVLYDLVKENSDYAYDDSKLKLE